MPGPERHRKGLQQTVRSMPGLFVALAKYAGITEVFDELPAFRPNILPVYKGMRPVLSEVTREDMVM